jgi:hypothetical protein
VRGCSSSISVVVEKESMQEYFGLPTAERWLPGAVTAGFRSAAAGTAGTAGPGAIGMADQQGGATRPSAVDTAAAAAAIDAAAAGAFVFPPAAVPLWAQEVLGPGAPCDAAAARQLLLKQGLAPPPGAAAATPIASRQDATAGLDPAGDVEMATNAANGNAIEAAVAGNGIGAAGAVDGQYATAAWVANHYKWVVWKLSSYDCTLLQAGIKAREQLQPTLTLDNVVQQLQFRWVQSRTKKTGGSTTRSVVSDSRTGLVLPATLMIPLQPGMIRVLVRWHDLVSLMSCLFNVLKS